MLIPKPKHTERRLFGKAAQPNDSMRCASKRKPIAPHQSRRWAAWYYSNRSAPLTDVIARLRRESRSSYAVNIGDRVTLFCVDEQRLLRCRIVKSTDSFPPGDISCLSPLGSQVVGRRAGSKIMVKLFGRSLCFYLLKIHQQS